MAEEALIEMAKGIGGILVGFLILCLVLDLVRLRRRR